MPRGTSAALAVCVLLLSFLGSADGEWPHEVICDDGVMGPMEVADLSNAGCDQAFCRASDHTSLIRFTWDRGTYVCDTLLTFAPAQIRLMQLGDTDQDGVQELYLTTTVTEHALYRIDYDGQGFSAMFIDALPGDSKEMVVGAGMNQPGSEEIYIFIEDQGIYAYRHLEGSAWAATHVYDTTELDPYIAIGDLDRDGLNELYATHQNGWAYLIRLDFVDPSWQSQDVCMGMPLPQPDGDRDPYVTYRGLLMADLEDDGWNDLYLLQETRNYIDGYPPRYVSDLVLVQHDADSFFECHAQRYWEVAHWVQYLSGDAPPGETDATVSAIDRAHGGTYQGFYDVEFAPGTSLIVRGFSQLQTDRAGSRSFSHQGRVFRLHCEGDHYHLDLLREYEESEEWSSQLGMVRAGQLRESAESLIYSYTHENQWLLLEALSPYSQGLPADPWDHSVLSLRSPTLLGASQSAEMQLRLSAPAHVEITVHDLTGRLIDTVVRQKLSRGFHVLAWPGSSGHHDLKTGVYWARLSLNGVPIEGQRLVIVK